MELVQMKKVYYDAGNRIRYLREKQHYTREQLAEMADISPKFLYEIESGQVAFARRIFHMGYCCFNVFDLEDKTGN